MKLKISSELSLPSDAATQKMAFLGRTGSGKTYGASRMVEQMLEAGIQTVILDPVGVWYGLRLLADGSPGFPVPVFGGLKGDIPLEPTGGALVADLVVDRGISIVIDVSQFESDADKARFARDFANRFFFRKKASPSAVHLVIEECQEFIPENPRQDEKFMLHAFVRICKLGRNFGIGASLISQRPQEVSKKALNQTELLFAFQMTGPHERKAIQVWMSEKGVDADLAGELPGLKVGQCFAWSPQWLRISEKITILPKLTINSSSTPGTGTKAEKRDLAPIDLEKLAEKMKDTIERAKADDPKLLRQKIAKLESEARAVKPSVVDTKVVEIPILTDIDRGILMNAIEVVGVEQSRIRNVFRGLEVRISTFQPRQSSGRVPSVSATQPAPARRREASPDAGSGTSSGLSKCTRALLTVLVQFHPKTCSKNRVALVSGYSLNSSGFSNALSELRVAGFIEGSSELRPTDAGIEIAGNVPPLPTGEQAVDHWVGRVGKCASALLSVVRRGRITRTELAQQAGYSETSSGFSNALSELRVLGLIESDRESVWLNPELE